MDSRSHHPRRLSWRGRRTPALVVIVIVLLVVVAVSAGQGVAALTTVILAALASTVEELVRFKLRRRLRTA